MASWKKRCTHPRGRRLASVAAYPVIGLVDSNAGSTRRRRHYKRSRSAADVAHLDAWQVGRALRADLRVPVGTTRPDRRDRLADLAVGSAGAQKRSQIVASRREEACVEAAFRGDPGARAVAAERLRHRRDDPDPAGAVAVPVAAGDLAPVGRLDRLEWEHGVDGGEDLGGRDHVVEPPPVRGADVHVLDEAEHVAGVPEVLRQRYDLAVVEPALDDGVHLHRQTYCGRRVDPLEDPIAGAPALLPLA